MDTRLSRSGGEIGERGEKSRRDIELKILNLLKQSRGLSVSELSIYLTAYLSAYLSVCSPTARNTSPEWGSASAPWPPWPSLPPIEKEKGRTALA